MQMSVRFAFKRDGEHHRRAARHLHEPRRAADDAQDLSRRRSTRRSSAARRCLSARAWAAPSRAGRSPSATSTTGAGSGAALTAVVRTRHRRLRRDDRLAAADGGIVRRAEDAPQPPRRMPQLNTMRDVGMALRSAGAPPAAAGSGAARHERHRDADFHRSGALLGEPRFTYVTPEASAETKALYQRAAVAAINALHAAAVHGSARQRGWRAAASCVHRPAQSERNLTDGETTDNTLILDTTKGTVVIEMRPDLAPGHVARIKELVREGFYDGIVFHRVIDGFMAQTGCPHGTGTGGSGKKLKAEFNKRAACARHRARWRARRTRIPATASSSSASTTRRFLDGQYTVWGKVTRAWRTSTRSSAASRCAIPTRSSRRRWRRTRSSDVPPISVMPA